MAARRALLTAHEWVALGAVLVLVTGLAIDPQGTLPVPVVMTGALALGFVPLGLFLHRARPSDRVTSGVLFVGHLALLAVTVAPWSGWLFAAWLTQWTWWPPVAAIPLLLLVFPNGRLPGPRWRWLAGALAGAGSIAAGALAGAAVARPRSLLTSASALDGGPRWLLVVAVLAVATSLVLSLGTVAALMARYRHADALGRRQLVCLVPAAVLLLLGAAGDAAGLEYAVVPGVLSLPLGIGVAIMQFQLHDLDLVVDRSLVWLGMTLIVLAVYVLSVVVLGERLFGDRPLLASAFGTALVAAGFDPVRRHLQRAVDRFLFGRRAEPSAALRSLGRRMQAAQAPASMFEELVRAIAETLRVPFVRLCVLPTHEERATEVAACGRRLVEPRALPLQVHGETVGLLEVSPRRSGESFTPRERALLQDIAGQAAQAVLAHRLALDLQRARERLVLSREEERLRLRRDLHDGLGPALVGSRMQLSVARSLLGAGEPRSLVEAVVEDLAACSQDVRRLIDGLRPAELDDGLGPGLQHAVPRLLPGHEVTVALDLEAAVVSPAVEVAAFRIAMEAVTNVAKHARAGSCRVVVRAREGDLSLEVHDDGRGVSGAASPGGVGLESMRVRAEELGGSLVVESPAKDGRDRQHRREGQDGRGPGTSVVAVLPLHQPA